MPTLTVEIFGDREAENLLAHIAERATFLQPAWKAIEEMQEDIEKHDPDSPFAHGRLIDTGRLKASFTDSASWDALRQITSDELIFGSSVRYARPAASKAHTYALVVGPRGDLKAAEVMLDYIVNGGSLHSIIEGAML